MGLKSLLYDALKDEFKSRVVVEAIEELITSKVEKEITQKYKDITLFKDGMEFELFAVKVACRTYFTSFEKGEVLIVLHYTCKSKLPKDKLERLEQIKKRYDHHVGVYLGDRSSYKHPITHSLRYYIPLSEALSGSINLQLETINHSIKKAIQ